jgi:O-antigen/teichoic acid export membrane protein
MLLIAKLRAFGRKWRNTLYSTADHLWLLALWAVSTPVFIVHLGPASFGIWTIVNALIGLGGVMSFGFGESTIRYVSKYNARNDSEMVRKVVETSITLYAVTGLFFAALIYAAAPWISGSLLGLESDLDHQTVLAVRIAAYVIFITSYLKTLESVVNGFQRFDLSAKAGMLTRSFIILGNVALALTGYGIATMLLMAAIGLTGQTLLYYVLVRRRFVPRFRLTAWPHPEVSGEIIRFGLQVWLQISAGAMGNIIDRFLVGALVSPAAAGVYAVCVQLAQQTHLLVMRALAYLSPATSKTTATPEGRKELPGLFHPATRLSLFVIGITAVPLLVLPSHILTFWVGAEFAASGTSTLQILIACFSLLAATTVPYFMLNGSGFPHWNTGATLLNGIVLIATALVLIPKLGLIGAAIARLIAAPTLGGIFLGFHRHVLHQRQVKVSTFATLGWLGAILAGAYCLSLWTRGWPEMSALPLIGSVVIFSALGGGVAGLPMIVQRFRSPPHP